jgi:serine/threonine-protein kinase
MQRELGHGGMATVYLAMDSEREAPVALKLMRADLSSVLGRERFAREIELARRLKHPRIVPVLESGEAAGQPWFTMPFVPGESLRERLRREGTLAVAEAVRITVEAAEALAFAHAQGIVHRDVKPENLLFAADGATFLADFGVAFAVAETNEHLTGTGLSIGTPAYIAPEQATGRQAVDGRADQYALAVTCYEMLVGTAPFTGPSTAAVIAQRFTKAAPRVRAARADVSPRVERALDRALSLDPEARFESIEAFAAALTGTTGTGGVTAEWPVKAAGSLSQIVVQSAAWVVSLLGAIGAVIRPPLFRLDALGAGADRHQAIA